MTPRKKIPAALHDFLQTQAAGGVLLMLAALTALLVANSPLATNYFHLQHIQLGPLSLLHWINDGLMAGFFLLVTLEIRREFTEGALNTKSRRILPGIAALGGMLVPAAIYLLLNPEYKHGWAIPTATDIAFALGVLALLGSRVPVSLKIFLTALAIIDDLGAVLIIALFYTDNIAPEYLAAAVALIGIMAALNKARVQSLTPFLILGAALWVCLLNSGVHATLSGVALALLLPTNKVKTLEHTIHPFITFAILPLFGFANAGVALIGINGATLSETFAHPVTLGILCGLFFGKMIGVFGASLLAIKMKWAALPDHANFQQLLGVSILCGIGFTMSLFIGLLAFNDPATQDLVKLGVLAGSLLSAITGIAVLKFASK